MIVVHHLNNSRSQRILWLLEELNTPYRVETYRRDPKTNLERRRNCAPFIRSASHRSFKTEIWC
jgi:glutathione S-transferase